MMGWITRENKGFLIETPVGYISASGIKYGFTEINAHTHLFKSHNDALDFAIEYKLTRYRIVEFEFMVNYRHTEHFPLIYWMLYICTPAVPVVQIYNTLLTV